MLAIAAGPPLLAFLSVAYHANQPVLLHGRHGVGKSEILAQAATRLGIDLVVRDLSLMEPPDLLGIPRVGQDGRTHYAVPSFLPHTGCGLLIFEELNRCARYMQGPCLQLLTTRTLNDYTLPDGWLPCASVNDAADGYQTEDLDPALLSRFVRVRVVADVTQWVGWAQEDKRIHEKIVEFVHNSPNVFASPEANPRAWAYASRLLTTWERGERDETLLPVLLSGVLGDDWALAFLRAYHGAQHPLTPHDIIDAYPAHRAVVTTWLHAGRLDVIAASLELLKRHIQPQRMYDALLRNASHTANVEMFLTDLPADLKRQMQDWLKDRGFTALLDKAPRRRRRP